MRITYTLTRWDLFTASIRGLMSQRLTLGLFVGANCFFIWSLNSSAAKDISWIARIISIAVMLVAINFAIAAFILLWTALTVWLRQHRGVIGKHTLEITAVGLVETTELNQSTTRLDALHRIRRSRRCHLIYVTEMFFHAVPANPARVEGDVEAFISELERRRDTPITTPVNPST